LRDVTQALSIWITPSPIARSNWKIGTAPLGRGEGSSGLAFDSIEEGRATAT